MTTAGARLPMRVAQRGTRRAPALWLTLMCLPVVWPVADAVGRAMLWSVAADNHFGWGGDGSSEWFGLPPRVLAMLGLGLTLSILCGLVATALGACVAWALMVPRSGTWRAGLTALLLASFCCGSVVHLMAWRVVWSSATDGWAGWSVAVLVLGARYAPLSAALLCCGLMALGRTELEAAVCTGGGPAAWAIARGRIARLAAMSVAAVAALVFGESELPPLLGLSVFAEEFLSQVALQPSLDAAVAHGWPLMVVALLCGAWLTGMPRLGSATDGGDPFGWLGAWPMPSPSMQVAATVTVVLFALPLMLLALGSALAEGRWPQGAWAALTTSLVLAAVAAGLATVWAWLLTEAAARAGGLAVATTHSAMLVVMLWPSTLTGLAVSAWALPDALGSATPLVLSHALRVLPFSVWLLLALRDGQSRAPREQLLTLGVPWWSAWRHVLLPAAAPALTASLLLCMGLSLSELGATVLTVPAGTETAILRLYNLMHYGDQRGVLSLALAQAALVSALCGLVWIQRRGRHAGGA